MSENALLKSYKRSRICWASCSSFDENAIETEDQLSQCIQNTFTNISVSAGVFERI